MVAGNLRIGVALADLAVFEAVDPAYGIGDQRLQVEAAIGAARARGDLPVARRDLELLFRTFDAVDPDGKRAVAAAFAADGVAAVIGARDFTYGAVALAERHHIPVIDVNAVPTSVLRRCAPYLFTLRTAQDVLYRSYVRWAHQRGFLTGRRIGIFSDRFTTASSRAAEAELAAHGHDVVLHVESDGLGYGSSVDGSAADRFHAAHVELLLPFVSGSSLVELLRSAADGPWRPTVVDLETGEHATDVTASLMPPSIYDGTWALVMNRVGEDAAGLAPSERTRGALAAYEAAAGRPLARSGRASSGELSNVLIVADLVDLLVAALHHASGDATPEAIVAGFESISGRAVASGGDVTFGPEAHWGFRQVRPIRWDAGRGAWAVHGPYESLRSD
jgi:hypothetical protein